MDVSIGIHMIVTATVVNTAATMAAIITQEKDKDVYLLKVNYMIRKITQIGISDGCLYIGL